MAYTGKFRKRDLTELMSELDLDLPDNLTIVKVVSKHSVVDELMYDEVLTKFVLNDFVANQEEKDKNARDTRQVEEK